MNAQLRGEPNPPPHGRPAPKAQLYVEDGTLRTFEKVRNDLQSGEAVTPARAEVIHAILKDTLSAPYCNEESGQIRFLPSEAAQLMRGLSAEARERYAIWAGEKKIDPQISTASLWDLALQYRFTQTGKKAMELLFAQALDSGDEHAARLYARTLAEDWPKDSAAQRRLAVFAPPRFRTGLLDRRMEFLNRMLDPREASASWRNLVTGDDLVQLRRSVREDSFSLREICEFLEPNLLKEPSVALLEAFFGKPHFDMSARPLALAGLGSENPRVRIAALQLVEQFSPKLEFVPILAGALAKETDPKVRNILLATLSNMKAEADELVPLLTDVALSDKHNRPDALDLLKTLLPHTKKDIDGIVLKLTQLAILAPNKHAVDSLAAVGPRARAMLPLLRQVLRSPDASKVQAQDALTLLSSLGASARPAQTELLKYLDRVGEYATVAPAEMATGLRVLGRIGDPEIVAPELSKHFKHPSHSIRQAAFAGIGKIGPRAKTVVPALMEILEGDDLFLKTQAYYTLADIGPDAEAALPKLYEVVARESDGEASYAAAAIPKLDPPKETLIPLLKTMLAAGGNSRTRALYMIAEMGPELKKLAPLLLSLVKGRSGFEKDRALEALSAMGPAAHDTIAALGSDDLARVFDKFSAEQLDAMLDSENRVLFHTALDEISTHPIPHSAIPKIVKRVFDDDLRLASEAFRLSLTKVDRRLATHAIIDGIQSLEDPHRLSRAPLWLLGTYGKDAQDAVPTLLNLLDTVPEHRQDILSALGDIGDPRALPALQRTFLGGDPPDIRRLSATSLAKLGPQGEDFLIAQLESKEPDTQVSAAMALRDMENPTDPVIDAMKECLHSDKPIATQAKHALSHWGIPFP